jgi:hypothetical protein
MTPSPPWALTFMPFEQELTITEVALLLSVAAFGGGKMVDPVTKKELITELRQYPEFGSINQIVVDFQVDRLRARGFLTQLKPDGYKVSPSGKATLHKMKHLLSLFGRSLRETM